MKHNTRVTLILILMFFVAQLIGLYVAQVYLPQTVSSVNQETGLLETKEVYNLPYGVTPPEQTDPTMSVISIFIALIIAVCLVFLLMKIKAEVFLKLWFLIVVILGISIALNAFLIKIPNASIIALIIAIPLAIVKIFKRDMIVHNFTELLIYPGIASVFIPILNLQSIVVLLVLISFYDMYAVWRSGFMVKMAKYQMETLKIFSGFFIPYMDKKTMEKIKAAKNLKSKKEKKVPVNIAILGGGDVVFPLITAGVALRFLGIWPALIITATSTLALTYLLYTSEKGKYYPAMPFIAIGSIAGIIIGYALF